MYTSRMLADYIEELCDTFNDAMCVTDRNGICVLVNRRHSELTGIPKRDIVGHRVQDMVLHGVFDTQLNSKVVETGQDVKACRTFLMDGGCFWMVTPCSIRRARWPMWLRSSGMSRL